MNLADITIRVERPVDVPGIRKLLEIAFGGDAEADLVENLRADRDLAWAQVAVDPNGAILGYVAFPRLALVTASWRDASISFYRREGWHDYGRWFVKPLADDVTPGGQPLDDN